MKVVYRLALTLALASLAVACTAQQTQQSQTQAKDLSLVPQVIAKLATVDVDAVTRVHVAQDNGVITLTGEARSSDERGRYVDAAKSIDGVTDVRDQLTIDPNIRGPREQSADAALTAKVEAVIAGQSGVNVFHVSPSVHGGVVVLTGTVPTVATDRVIVQAVRGVDGVKSVTDRISVR